MDLRRRLLDHVSATRLFDEPGLALLAVSGGSDSVALLDLIVSLAPELGLMLAVAHVSHGIQPETAAVVPRVSELAASFGLPCHVEQLSLGPKAGETLARRARYRALRSIQHAVGARYLVTAHQQDDQVETVLFRFLRGSAVAGLAGIPSKGPDGLVRPLLPFGRQELNDWLLQRYPDPATRPFLFDDPANADLRYDRVWLRHELLPLLRQRFGSSLEQCLVDVGKHAEAERAAWTHVLRALPDLEFSSKSDSVELARPPLDRYDKALSQAVLRAAAREIGCRLGPRRADLLLDFATRSTSGHVLRLGSGYEAHLVFDRVRLSRGVGPNGRPPQTVALAESREGRVRWGGWEFTWQLDAAGTPRRVSLTTWVTHGRAEVRAPQSGERVVPLGGVGRRKVVRMLMEARIAAFERHQYPVVVRGAQILWIPGVCRSAEAVPQVGQPAVRLEARATGHR